MGVAGHQVQNASQVVGAALIAFLCSQRLWARRLCMKRDTARFGWRQPGFPFPICIMTDADLKAHEIVKLTCSSAVPSRSGMIAHAS